MSHRFAGLCIFLVAIAGADPLVATETAAPEGDPGMAAGNPTTMERSHIEPAHVLARVRLLERHAADLRWLMGRPEVQSRLMHIRNAQPREVYYQAELLFRKANRIALERLGESVEPPPWPPVGEIRPANVHDVILKAQDRLLAVRRALGLARPYQAGPPDPGATPSDVYARVLAAGRLLDSLSLRNLGSADSLRVVKEAQGQLELLLRHAGAPPIAVREEPPGQGHTPGDVFHRLLHCMQILAGTMEAADFEVLQVTPMHTRWVLESDVVDAATLIISELDFLNSGFGTDRAPAEPAPDGPTLVVPSQVMRSVGQLEQMLIHLDSWVRANPGRLRGGG